MSWQEPRVWAADDRFNISDYNRIKGNLEYLHEKAEELYHTFQISNMGSDKADYSAYFYASEFNTFEQNIDTINQNIFSQDFGVRQTFYDNGSFIQWEELNRIEAAILSMYQLLERQETVLRRLSFRLGNMKGVAV